MGNLDFREFSDNYRLIPRDLTETPTNAQCKIHLRRTCGSCIHFTGPVIRTTGKCRAFQRQGKFMGTKSAITCEMWERK